MLMRWDGSVGPHVTSVLIVSRAVFTMIPPLFRALPISRAVKFNIFEPTPWNWQSAWRVNLLQNITIRWSSWPCFCNKFAVIFHNFTMILLWFIWNWLQFHREMGKLYFAVKLTHKHRDLRMALAKRGVNREITYILSISVIVWHLVRLL